MPQVPSTRWSPTPEQLMILEEMYRSGVRTPNASQIQQITAHLSFYGKIEGKNVFYWFQNHKARERQKLRRRLGRQQQQQQQQQPCPQHISQLNNLDNASLTSSPPYPHSLSPFLHQEGIQEETEGLDLLGKLETGGRREEASSSGASSRCRCEWMAMLEPCSTEPPMTLELFPTQSTGLRDECSTSKSSSCSASTN